MPLSKVKRLEVNIELVIRDVFSVYNQPAVEDHRGKRKRHNLSGASFTKRGREILKELHLPS